MHLHRTPLIITSIKYVGRLTDQLVLDSERVEPYAGRPMLELPESGSATTPHPFKVCKTIRSLVLFSSRLRIFTPHQLYQRASIVTDLEWDDHS